MRFFSALGIFFYTIVISLVGGLLIGFALHLIEMQDVMSILGSGYQDYNLRIIIGAVGMLLIFISIYFAQLIFGRMQKEKTIAFTNPSGQVTVSLSAVEDLVRRLTSQVSDVRESRPDVVVTKKGINVNLRIVLCSDANIPELTSSLQELIKSRVQEILGVEEPILVRIHVSKIISLEERAKKKKISEKEEEQPAIPFQGYRKT